MELEAVIDRVALDMGWVFEIKTEASVLFLHNQVLTGFFVIAFVMSNM